MQTIFDVRTLVAPAGKNPQCLRIEDTLVAGVVNTVDFRDVGLDGVLFLPQGVLIDCTDATGPCTVTINGIDFKVTCAAGGVIHVPYPAVANQTANYTGEGDTRIFFVDYVVFPFTNIGGGGMSGVQSIVAGTGIAVDNTDPANPVVSATGGGGGTSAMVAATLVLNGTNGPANMTPAAVGKADGFTIDNVTGDITVPAGITYVTVNLSTIAFDNTSAARSDIKFSLFKNGADVFANAVTQPLASGANGITLPGYLQVDVLAGDVLNLNCTWLTGTNDTTMAVMGLIGHP